ncbi:Single-stranded DNA-binding protein WHY1 [Spatholobus suberectus]|nr:Single-stranded DNA-binding protein WHY1 [Spatholobus suberectus]
MSQVQSISLKHHLSPPTHSFVPPKFIIPLKRNFSFATLTLPSLSVKCYSPNLVQPKPFPSPPQRPPVGELPPRVFVGYSVYTRKGVLKVSPRPPEFEAKNSGAFKVSREGYVLLQFAPSVGTDESIYEYDWNQKQVFSLSVSEMGTLISLGAMDSWEFFHETIKAKSNEFEVRKVLKVEPLLDATGHLLSLSVQKKSENMEEIQESIFLPVTRAELAVLRTIFNYIMPYLLGWNAFANSIKPEVYSRVNSSNPRYGADDEWNR